MRRLACERFQVQPAVSVALVLYTLGGVLTVPLSIATCDGL